MLIRSFFIVAVLTNSACGLDPLSVPAGTPSGVGGSAPTYPAFVATSCPGAGSIDFRAELTGLQSYDGKRVYFAAIEPEPHAGGAIEHRTMHLSTMIRSGAASAQCSNALSPNMSYPALAAFVDVNNDGQCNDGDLGFDIIYYGWVEGAPITLNATAANFQTISGSSRYPNGFDGPIVGDTRGCAAYFPATR